MIRKFRSIILIAIMVLLAVCPVSADTPNFTRILPSSDMLIVNYTYTSSSETTTPVTFFVMIAALGIGMLGLSILLKPEVPYDMIGYIAPVPLFFGFLMSFMGIDIKTTSGAGAMIINGMTKVVIIENHTIYRPFLLIVLMLVIFLISCLNVMRIKAAKAKAALPFKEPED